MFFVVIVRTHHAPFCGHRLPAMDLRDNFHSFICYLLCFYFGNLSLKLLRAPNRLLSGKKSNGMINEETLRLPYPSSTISILVPVS